MSIEVASGYWTREFARSTARRSEEFQAAQLRLKTEWDQEFRAEKIKRDKEQGRMVMMRAVLASPQQIAEFEVKLDAYDQATVTALMENQQQLDEVRARLDKMLLEAHVLPDGRRVFKTKDGKRVFDENGKEVSAEEVKPDEIDDKNPTWEMFDAKRQQQKALEAEQQRLHEYQGKLDKARDRVRDKDNPISEDDLKELERELQTSMPESGKNKLQGHLKEEVEAAVKAETTPAAGKAIQAASVDISMDDLAAMAESKPAAQVQKQTKALIPAGV